jgi:hypothetical protein
VVSQTSPFTIVMPTGSERGPTLIVFVTAFVAGSMREML